MRRLFDFYEEMILPHPVPVDSVLVDNSTTQMWELQSYFRPYGTTPWND